MKKYIWFYALIIVLAGCTFGEVLSKNYYILEYYPHSEKEELKLETSIDKSVFILDAKVSKTYNRSQIVMRHFGPRITYLDYDLWGVKLSKIIPDMVQKRFESYNVFETTHREFLGSKADMEIATTVNNIELYKSGNLQQARVVMDLALRNSGEEGCVVEHSVNTERVLLANDIDTFVQTVNEIILDETDNFVRKIIRVCYIDADSKFENKDLIALLDSTLIQLNETESAGEGKGLLLLPAISGTDSEPYFKAIDRYGFVQSGQMGTPLPLLEGNYTIEYGSGNANQHMTQSNIEVVPRFKSIIEPDWGCLIVDVMDEKRNYSKVRYEIFDLGSGESFGSEFPAEEEIGEQATVWALKPGLHKITVNNEPFNTYANFTTVYVKKGEVIKFTIVMDTDDDDNPTNMIGAGVLEESFLEASLEKLKFSSAIHGNANIRSDNENDKDNAETTIDVNLQLENYLIYDEYPLHYTMKNLIELGTTKASGDDFRLSEDSFDLKNTLIYYFVQNLGVYGRFDAETHFFNENIYDSNDFYCTKIDKDGDVLLDSVLVDKVQVSSSFFPLKLKEGVGINYRILNKSKSNLSIRGGFGLRQEINNDAYLRTNTGDSYRMYQELDSVSKTGMELSLVGSFQLPYNISYSTNADFLFPFDKEEYNSMEWENVINLKLFKHISLDYKLKLLNKVPEIGDEYIATNHTLFLRITYFLK
jgi:ABC-type uncharacterized transport system auxiliary subunit